ncbi:MAG: globin [Bdellovibrionaceae bacterium]|nr:globin [Pseudobdellovibrionaceae bacterium]|tara:strand:+ start:106671 stop:107051 length:381 start_codon:yes stop_codon:yes gene_type:complete
MMGDSMSNATNLFDKYGGFETLAKLVHEFYSKLLEDSEIKPYFQAVDLEKLMQHQVNFLGLALGGPNKYEGKDLGVAHKHLNISEEHFLIVAGYLEEVLDEAGVDESDIAAIMAVVGSTKEQIVAA